MLLAVGIISTSVFILNPGHWKQVQSLLNTLALPEKNAKVVYVFRHSKKTDSTGSSMREVTSFGFFSRKHVYFCKSGRRMHGQFRRKARACTSVSVSSRFSFFTARTNPRRRRFVDRWRSNLMGQFSAQTATEYCNKQPIADSSFFILLL